jgi:hypothetical protein
MDSSPFYEDEQLYLDDRDLLDLTPTTADSTSVNGPVPQKQPASAFSKTNKVYKKIKPYYPLQKFVDTGDSDREDTTLVFESRFESGNLRRAVQVGEDEYDLILKYDYGTTNYTQWFYFSVKNTRKDVRYKFNIINLVKPDSSYNQGMKPLLYSKLD